MTEIALNVIAMVMDKKSFIPALPNKGGSATGVLITDRCLGPGGDGISRFLGVSRVEMDSEFRSATNFQELGQPAASHREQHDADRADS